MARPHKFKAGILNVVIHPHSPERYVKLIMQAFELRQIIALDGDKRAYLGSCFPIGKDPLDGLEGSIFRFIEIDEDMPWLDTLTGSEAEPDDIEKSVKIPRNFKPNFCAIRYNFFPRSHKLVFEISRRDPSRKKPNTFPALTAQKFFQRLFGDNKLSRHFPLVEVTLIQETNALKEIFNIPRLKSLEIFIKRPNPTGGTIEEQLERELEEENVQSKRIEFKSSGDAKGLQPSLNTQALANIALSNGWVSATGVDAEGERIERNTEAAPRIVEGKYSKEYSPAFTALATKVSTLARKVG